MARVLIVGGDHHDRLLLRAMLERGGHAVSEAQDAGEALQIFDPRQVEVVVTDLEMTGVHGLELITVLRDFDPRPVIVAISGTGESQLDIARAVGATATLTKPVVPEPLLEAVGMARVGSDAPPEAHPSA